MTEFIRKILNLIGIALIVAAITGITFYAGYHRGFDTGRTGTASLYPSPAELAEGPGSIFDRLRNWTHSNPTPAEAAKFRVFWEAWTLLKDEFYGPLPDEQELTYSAIRGVLRGLNDPHTSLLPPEDADLFQSDMEGGFEGIGARVNLAEQGGIEIVETFQNQPAWEAGIRRGDIVITVDDQDVTNLTLMEGIGLIRGPEGSPVLLTVYRPGEDRTFDVEVIRRRIEIPIVESDLLDGNIAYLHLAEFNGVATSRMRAEINRLLLEEPSGMILDLRGNPGGLLSAAIEIGSFFLEEGNILLEEYYDGRLQEHPRRGDLLVPSDLPLTVLVDRASASAAEIVAGAIQDSGRGTLIGERTFGKGSVQLPHTLSDGSLLRVTIARWLTPSGREIHGEGLKPDIEVERSLEDLEAGHDPQLDYAVSWLLQ